MGLKRPKSIKRNDLPAPSSPAAAHRMRVTRQRNTGIEKSLRSALHRLGLRFRLHRRLLNRSSCTVDLVFASARVAVFVDSCYWHGCPEHGTLPKANRDWWRAKLAGNRKRDRKLTRRLQAEGWHVIRIWEHDDFQSAALRISLAVKRGILRS